MPLIPVIRFDWDMNLTQGAHPMRITLRNTLLSLVAVLTMAMSVGLVDADPAGAIVGGTTSTASHDDVAGIVRLFASDTDQVGFCGGFVYDEHTVVTAAHCVDNRIGVFVRVGTADLNAGGTRHASRAIHIHPEFDEETLANDVAVLELASAITAPVLTIGDSPAYGEELTVYGWGMTGEDSGQSNNLRSAIVTKDRRSSQTKFVVEAISYGDGGLTCPGDSGSPVMYRTPDGPRVVGVHSSGFRPCGSNIYAISAR